LTNFGGLIISVIFVSHIMACIWLALGAEEYCVDSDNNPKPDCVLSWIPKNTFDV
jgi:hypothetical protein